MIEFQHRLTLPYDHWDPVGDVDGLTTDARIHLTALAEASAISG